MILKNIQDIRSGIWILFHFTLRAGSSPSLVIYFQCLDQLGLYKICKSIIDLTFLPPINSLLRYFKIKGSTSIRIIDCPDLAIMRMNNTL